MKEEKKKKKRKTEKKNRKVYTCTHLHTYTHDTLSAV